ncbi:Protein of unknown function [Leuconostoc citreum LBAE C10]|nr:Protein of unknown function [Leuconostoc citreum LBAE C10]
MVVFSQDDINNIIAYDFVTLKLSTTIK